MNRQKFTHYIPIIPFISFWLVSFLPVQAQTSPLTGRIIDESTQEGLPGASVVLKGSTHGVVTDAQGNFKFITAQRPPLVLVVSYIGYQQREVTIADYQPVTITLTTSLQLDEVVVTALGIEREKKEINYSVTQVSGRDIANTREPNLTTALSGRIAGVQIGNSGGSPGGSSTVRIRGNSSILGNNSPLFIVDGIPVDNSIQDLLPNITNNLSLATPSNRAIDINSDDIESISVLKGPAAAALYGIRAANGAVVITTKHGSSQTNKPVSVSFSTSVTFDKVNRRLQPRQTRFSNGLNGQYLAPGLPGSDENWGALLDTLTYSSVPSLFDRNGLIVGQSDARSNGVPVNRYDNSDTFFQTGVTQSYHLGVSGKMDKASYYASAGRLYQTGIIPTTDFYRTTLRFNGDFQATDRLSISSGLNFINSGSNNRALMGGFNTNVLRALINTPPNFDITNGLAHPADNPDAYKLPATAARPWGDSRSYANGRGWDSPYWSLNMNPQNDDVNRFLGYGQANYKFTDWLDATLRYGIDNYRDYRKGSFSRGTSGVSNGVINEINFIRRDVNTDFILSAKHDISSQWHISANVGHNYYNSYRYQNNVRADGLITPGLFNVSNASTVSTTIQTARRKLVAVFGNASLSYKDWLFLTLTGRNEWTSTLPKGSNSFFYPSIGAGWLFTEALHLTNNWLSLGKLRGTYAVVGNDADPYSLQTYYTSLNQNGWIQSSIQTPFNNTSGLTYENTEGNPKLKPERISSWEGGLDLEFLNGKIGLEATYYANRSRDQIIPVSLPTSTGSSATLINTGEITNKGVEVSLSITPIRTADFKWTHTLVYSRNVSKVVALAPGLSSIYLGGVFTDSRAVVGQPYGALVAIDLQRNAVGKPIIDATPTLANGQPNANYGYPLVNTSPTVVADPNPKFNASWRNELTYKFVSFSFLLDTRYGFAIANMPRSQMVFNGVALETDKRGTLTVFDGVKSTEGNAANDIEVPLTQSWYRNTFNIPALYVEKDLYWLRLREINLSFALPKALLTPLKVAAASVTLTGRNFLLGTNYTGSDPDLSSRNGLQNALGIDFWTTPNTKSYGASLNVTF